MSQRTRRVSEAIKEIVAQLLPGLKDPRIGFVTVTEVRTTPDLGSAEVFFTVLPDDEESLRATEEGLRSATALVRREVGAQLRLRRVPDLHFTHDPLPEHSRRIESLLADAQTSGEDDVNDADR